VKRRETAEQLMAKRRRAERKAGIVRDLHSKAAPFSTILARQGHPHGKTAASRRSVGLNSAEAGAGTPDAQAAVAPASGKR
jgi:hypothetical protein